MLGSHPVPSNPYLQACDEVVREPEGSGDVFVARALEICAAHQVDVFVPGRERAAVARARADFEAAGVRVQTSPADAIETLETKGSTHERAVKLGVAVPDYRLVEDIEGFRAAVRELTSTGASVCFKPDLDHGGHGFRIIDPEAHSLAALREPPSVRIAPEAVEALLAEVETFDPLIVSEYLPGVELSIDCLSSPEGELLVALPRRKGGLEWTRELVRDEAALDIARAMVEGCGLRYLSNVQVKYAADPARGPVLLEVNTRAASGLYQSVRASGVNLPALALALTLDEDVTIPEPAFGAAMVVYNEAVPFELPR